MKKLAIITTHPIQYNAPLFKLLAKSNSVKPKVFYTWDQTGKGSKYDPGFGKKVEWDIPLLEGYEYTFVKNISTDPGSHHFKGIVNPSLIQEIEKWKPDAVLVYGWSFQSHLRCMRYFHKKIPVFFRGDSTLVNETRGIKKAIRTVFLRWVYSYVDYVLYVGTHNKDYFLRHGVKEKQLILAPHAIDNERFAEPNEKYETEASSWRKKIGIVEDDLVLVFAGKIEPVKNPMALIDIAKRCSNPKLKIILIGNGELETMVKQSAKDDKRIIFIDFQNQSQMPVVYRLGDVFILTSRSETWGLGINEAMACGRAIIASTKVGCAPDLIKEEVNGLVYNTNSVDIAVSFLEKLLRENGLSKTMGNNSKQIIKNFSFERIVAAIENQMAQL